MPDRSCTMPGCGKPYRAKGLCSTHYNVANRPNVQIKCAACGRIAIKGQNYRGSRRGVCSLACRAFLQFGKTECSVPATHPSRSTPVPADHPSRIQLSKPPKPAVCACAWCGIEYAPMSGNYSYCTRACGRRHKMARRRGRERGWSACYTWTQVITVLLRFDHCCAYCGEWVDQPEPDHVVPLSRGGSNGIGNILPSCKADNSDKRDLLLSEWNADRARRGLAPRTTSWDADDPRVAHLSMRSRCGAPAHAA